MPACRAGLARSKLIGLLRIEFSSLVDHLSVSSHMYYALPAATLPAFVSSRAMTCPACRPGRSCDYRASSPQAGFFIALRAILSQESAISSLLEHEFEQDA